MQNTKQTALANRRKAWLYEGRALLPLLFIWGIEWIFSALVDVGIAWWNIDWLKQAAFITAVIASLIQIWQLRKNRQTGPSPQTGGGQSSGSGLGNPVLLLLPGAMLVAAVALLEAVGAVSPLFSPVLRGFLLAVGFVQFGLLLGKPLLYLGLWMFALTAVISVWYLGYSAVVLEGMGGISLLACGSMLKVWGK